MADFADHVGLSATPVRKRTQKMEQSYAGAALKGELDPDAEPSLRA